MKGRKQVHPSGEHGDARPAWEEEALQSQYNSIAALSLRITTQQPPVTVLGAEGLNVQLHWAAENPNQISFKKEQKKQER